MLSLITSWLSNLFTSQPNLPQYAWQATWSDFLLDKVAFYQGLQDDEQRVFEQRCLQFINTTRIEAGQFDVTDEDRLLVAASAVIPVWHFESWHYFNLAAVFLLPGAFNDNFECSQPDSTISGMVGTGPMAGKMALSRPHLHLGFNNSKDKRNVGIHEFVHMIDMMDGICDGVPERLHKFASIALWQDFIHKKTNEIAKRKTNIRQYATMNPQEFLATTSEYFFERPELLKRKHPELYEWLSTFYKQNSEP